MRGKHDISRAVTLTSWLVFCAVLGTSAAASAYVRTQTCSLTGDTSRFCDAGQTPVPVYWPDPCVTYYINRTGTDDIPGANGQIAPEVERAIIDSFEAWNAPGCGAIGLMYGGLTCNAFAGSKEHPRHAQPQHVIVWREEWSGSSSTIAVTLVNANTTTGQIKDADIEVNGFHYTFRNLEQQSNDPNVVDIRNVLTHEVGHFIGLDHEQDILDATMFPDSKDGELAKRDLHQDDIEGMCSIYPFSGGEACSILYVRDDSCADVYEGRTSCAQVPDPIAPSYPWAPFIPVLFGGFGVWVRRRRARA